MLNGPKQEEVMLLVSNSADKAFQAPETLAKVTEVKVRWKSHLHAIHQLLVLVSTSGK